MKTILVVGIGTGSPEHMTIAAIEAINRANVLFVPDKGEDKAELGDLRRAIIARFVTQQVRQLAYAVPKRNESNPDYQQGVADWHDGLASIFTGLIAEIPENGSGAFLVWGDPGLYDSTLRILDRVTAPVRIEVIPGITAIQALTAAHGKALNRVGEPVLVTTGRKLGSVEIDSVVMLDGRQAFLEADPDLEIFWGAYLGSQDQLLISGRLGDVAQEIVATRKAARARHGWIMDTYLLRRRD
jgi:precorrin-6A synthase